MLSTSVSRAAAVAGLLASASAATFNAGSTQNVAMYWGQGYAQIPLSDVCNDPSIDIVNLAFVNGFPLSVGDYPKTNFANACWDFYPDPKDSTKNSGLLKTCPGVGDAIKNCQASGKKVLLSLGGGVPVNYTLPTQEIAYWFGEFLLGAFGPLTPAWSAAGKPRPFGDAAVDGFDLDIETDKAQVKSADLIYKGYDQLVNHIKALAPTTLISAAPQCEVPDPRLAYAISKAPFDFIFTQFYNTDHCSARLGYSQINSASTGFTFDNWVTWIKANSFNPNVKLYLGLPASSDASPNSPTHYLKPEEANALATKYKNKYPGTFGGISVWEATYAVQNVIYGQAYGTWMKAILDGTFLSKYKPVVSSSSSSRVSSSTPVSSSTKASSTPAISTTKASSTPVASSTKVSSTPVVSSTKVSSTPVVSSTKASSTPIASSAKPSLSSKASSTPAVSSTKASSTPTVSSTRASSTPAVSSTPVSSSSSLASSFVYSVSSVKILSSSAGASSSAPATSSSPAPASSIPSSSSFVPTSTPVVRSSVGVPYGTGSSSIVYPPFSTGAPYSNISTTHGAYPPGYDSAPAGATSTPCPTSSSTTSLPVYEASSSLVYGASGLPVYGASSIPVYGASSSAHPNQYYPVSSPAPYQSNPVNEYDGYPSVTKKVEYSASPSGPTGVTTTVITTQYVDECSTGLTTITTTITKTVPVGASKPTTTPKIDEGWTTSIYVCTKCGPSTTTITITKPVTPPTSVPAKPSTPNAYPPSKPSGPSYDNSKPSQPVYAAETPKKPNSPSNASPTSVVVQVVTLAKVPVPYTPTPVPGYLAKNGTTSYAPSGTGKPTSPTTYKPPQQFEGAASRAGVGLTAAFGLVSWLLML